MINIDINNLKEDANRCLLCSNARCKSNCPIDTPIPEIISLFKEERIKEAGEILFKNNPLSVICSIVCPHEKQCKGNCVRGIKGESINFSDIEYSISKDFLYNTDLIKENEFEDRIAIVGAGPAGIALAVILAIKGYKITIFEKNSKLGGVLRYGIPEFRLPREILDKIEERLLSLGVKIRYNTLVGPVITIDKLFKDGYKAIFIGTGVWNPKTLNIKGETLGHVHYAIDYLKEPKSYNLGEKVVVIGAGNVAMDAARSAKYYGAKDVTVLYRKGFEDMPATKVELAETKEDGVSFNLYKAPIEITEDGVRYIETKKVTGENGRISFVTLEDSEGIEKADTIIIAVSQGPKNNIVSNTENIETDKYGLLVTDNEGHTTYKGVFAAGDVVTGAKTVVEAVKDAKVAAEAIDNHCSCLRK